MARNKDGRTRMGGRMDDDGIPWKEIKAMAKEVSRRGSASKYGPETAEIRDLEASDRKIDRMKAQMIKDKRLYDK